MLLISFIHKPFNNIKLDSINITNPNVLEDEVYMKSLLKQAKQCDVKGVMVYVNKETNRIRKNVKNIKLLWNPIISKKQRRVVGISGKRGTQAV